MINQGIVTDSDTEKELKKWQQARATAVDEDKLKQQYKNRLNNAQGQHFEREILAGCRMYESHGIATIDKTPEPFRVTSKNHRTGEFTGRFSTHAQPDFQGTLYGGRSIMFEAKRTSKDRITRNVLTDTQMDVLEKHSRLGALCGVCICIQDDFFFIPWNVWRDMKEMYGRQYLKPDDIEEYKVKFDGAVHFLMHTEELKGAYENAERKDKIMELLTVTEVKEGGEVTFTDRSIEILQELGQQYKETPLFKKSRQDNPDWEGDANAGLLFVYMCERLTEATSRIHTIMVCKLMIPLIWEKLEQELQETATVADKKIEEDTAQGGLLSAT